MYSIHGCLQDVQDDIYNDEEDDKFTRLKIRDLNVLSEAIEAGRAILPHLEMLVVYRACSDPGPAVVEELILPIIQGRLEYLSRKHTAIQNAKQDQRNEELLAEAQAREPICNISQ